MTTSSQKVEMPSYNSQGMQVWDPSVGLYHSPGSNNRESYAGIVTALQDEMVAAQANAGYVPSIKSYPYNFAGIISAIQDLTLDLVATPPGANIGPAPTETVDGTLWFDTRQGRLFVFFEDNWYQTNGADGLAIITNEVAPDPNNLAIGQLWWDSQGDGTVGNLYIFTGVYKKIGGGTTTDPNLAIEPIWINVVGDSVGIQNTATLPLANPILPDPDSLLQNLPSSTQVIPDPPATLAFQKDANVYFMDCIEALDEAVENTAVLVSLNPPASPVVGQLWYDPSDLEMSIWYVDDAGGQWVPTTASYMQGIEIEDLRGQLSTEVSTREANVQSIRSDVTALQATTAVNAAAIAALPTQDDISKLATKADQSYAVNNLQKQVNSNVGEIASIYRNYMPSLEINNKFTAVNNEIAALPTMTTINSVIDSIPSVDGLASTSYVDTAVAGVVPTITRNGGTIIDSIVVEKADTNRAGIDFSQKSFHGNNSLRWRVYSGHQFEPLDAEVNLGTTPIRNELAWVFNYAEDLCWKHGDTKVASIASDGLAATNLYVAEFGSNTADGRVLVNKIDVGDRLTKHQTALNQMNVNVASATTLDQLKTAIISALASL